jgi:hypothetical protein
MRNVKLGIFAIALVGAGTRPAAAIECRDGYQRISGNDIATPYCQDEYLAVVARRYGMKASGEKIRNNPNYKREVCRLVGQDIRVQTTCIDELPSSRSGRF